MSNFKNLDTVEKLMGGYNPYRQRQEETRGLIKKWEPTGLLEGIDEDQRVSGMAVLLENQARQLIDESSHTGTSSNSEEWSGVALPLVRKIFGELAAQEFVSVQPMNLPSGLIFYLDFKYGTGQAGHTTSTGAATKGQVFGITSGSGDPSQGLYGAGRFGYSVNDVQTVPINATASAVSTTGSAVWGDVDFEPDLSSSISAGSIKKYDLLLSNLSAPDKEGAAAFAISSSTAFTAYYPAYTKIVNSSGTEVAPSDGAANKIRFLVKEASPLEGSTSLPATPSKTLVYAG